jgi:hypothetical protein
MTLLQEQNHMKPTTPLMTVAIRVRPLSQKELLLGHQKVVDVNGKITSITKSQRRDGHLQSEKGQLHSYEFDRCFDEKTSNEAVYHAVVEGLIPKILNGTNCTLLAYGSTGAGKTHTIMGNESDRGMMHRSMMDLFSWIEKRKRIKQVEESFSVSVSYMEVYCETIRDLLSDSDRDLKPCETNTGDGIVCVIGLQEKEVHNVSGVLCLVEEGGKRRRTEATAANEVSSRSHAVLQVTVRRDIPNPNYIPQKVLKAGSKKIENKSLPFLSTYSKLSLIDLAGSERASATLNTGIRLREAASINKSLLALANCINALSSHGFNRVKYRDSKLTHLLKSSLEGNCHVVMLAAVHPSHKCYEESHNTLMYANRAKNLKMKVISSLVLKPIDLVSNQEEETNENIMSFSNKTPLSIPASVIKRPISPIRIQIDLDEPITCLQDSEEINISKLTNESSSSTEENWKEEHDRVLEENQELKLRLSKADEVIALLQKMQQNYQKNNRVMLPPVSQRYNRIPQKTPPPSISRRSSYAVRSTGTPHPEVVADIVRRFSQVPNRLVLTEKNN